MSISSYLKGLHFLSGFLKTPSHNLFSIREEFFPTKIEDKSLRVKILHPKDKLGEKLPGVIVLHGMNKMGIEDPRILNLAYIITNMGYTTILPEVTEVTELKIVPETLDSVSITLETIVERSDMFLDERLGFFSVSFCGGMGMISITNPEISKKIKAIATIGSYSNFETTIPHVLENFELDNYGTCIFFYNYISYFEKNSENLKIYFYEAAMDNGLKRIGSSAKAPAILKKLSKKEETLLNGIENEKEFRKSLFEDFQKKSKSLMEYLSPINYVEKIFSSVSLVHGKGDIVIPEKETIELASRLNQFNKPFEMEITKLLSHGDTLPIWKQIPGVPGLASTFGYFFSNI
jgi:hypothetical protein